MEQELRIQEDGGQLEVRFDHSQNRIVLLWVDESDPTNWVYMGEQARRGLDALHMSEADALSMFGAESAQDAAAPAGESKQVGEGSNQVGATPSEATEPAAEDDSEPEYFWPNIQRYLESESHSGPRPSAKCAICLQGLFHPGLCSSGSRHHREALEVLECGHVIGRRCWGNVVLNALKEEKPPTCPFCRAKQLNWFWLFREVHIWECDM